MADDTEVDDDCESDECGASVPLVTESTEPLVVAPDEAHTIVLPYDAPSEMEGWPRRIRARRNRGRRVGGHAINLYLYYPNNPEETKQILFTADMNRRWLAARNETRNASSVATWGVKTTLQITASTLGENNTLTYTPGATEATMSLDVYNLDASQPKWRQLLQRSFAILPISHLQAANLKSVFLDFRVGTSRIGPTVPVGDGGTNWRLSVRRGVRRATRGIDIEGCSAVCATFASLNRAWGERDVADANLPGESGIDSSFDNPQFVIFTFYHELGHLLDYGGHTARAATASGRLSGSARNNLWGRYRDAMNYDGESDGAGEGFAEAYRQRMLGQAFAAHHSRLDAATTTRTIREMNEAFDSLGMPSLASVRAAWAVIRGG